MLKTILGLPRLAQAFYLLFLLRFAIQITSNFVDTDINHLLTTGGGILASVLILMGILLTGRYLRAEAKLKAYQKVMEGLVSRFGQPDVVELPSSFIEQGNSRKTI